MAAPLLCGIETEWFNAHFSQAKAASPESVAITAIQILKNRPHLPDESHGIFRSDSSRVYPDCGHLEHATGECRDPVTLVSYLKAFERTLLEIAPETAKTLGGGEVAFGRLNVDYASGATYGQHESYLTRHPPHFFEKALVPHLVTRAVYCGEGGLASEGTGLVVSPRLLNFTRVAHSDTIRERPIFNLRDESLSCGGFFRLHLTSGASLSSELALYLKVGFTALVVRTTELAGPGIADRLQIADPVSALHQVASDVACKERLRLADGGHATAIEIQKGFLSLVRRFLEQLPWWAPTVCDRLEKVLDALAEDPLKMSRTLDWTIKYGIYTSQLKLTGSNDVGSDLLAALYRAVRGTAYGDSRPPLQILLGASSPVLATVARLNEELVRRKLRWGDLKTDNPARARLAEIDTRFGLLGEGIFDQLDRQGLLEHKLIGESQIQQAATSPPAGSRARLRGDVTARLAGKSNVICTWQGIFDKCAGKALDLRNPWQENERWRPLEEFAGEEDALSEAEPGLPLSVEGIA